MSEKKLVDMTFEELVDHVSRDLHSGLLEGGGKELKARVHLWIGQAIYWQHETVGKGRESGRIKNGKGKKDCKGSRN